MKLETVYFILERPVEKWGKAMDGLNHWFWHIPPFNVLGLLFVLVTIIPVFLLGIAAISVDEFRRSREAKNYWKLSERLAMMPPESYNDTDEPERTM